MVFPETIDSITKNKLFFKQMYLIRKFEELLFDLFSKGEISGTIHTYLGQEAIAVGTINHLTKDDTVISNHRCHGHYLTYTNEAEGLLAEIMGKKQGICKGRGGSQHLHNGNFFSNGVQGNMFPVAAGMALAEKERNTNNLVVIFIGDGTFGQGVIYETFNLLSLLEIPLLVIVENNGYAQSTPISLNFRGSFKERIKSFDISYGELTTNDVNVIFDRFEKIIPRLRTKKFPHVEVINTYRLGPHSKGDDTRPVEEVMSWEKKDPITMVEKTLPSNIVLEIKSEVDNYLHEIYTNIKNN